MEIKVLQIELTAEEIAKTRDIASQECTALKEVRQNGDSSQTSACEAPKKDGLENGEEENMDDPEDSQQIAETVMFSPDQLSSLFAHLLDVGESWLSKEAFLRISRYYMKVIKDTVMTSGQCISTSTVVKRLEVNDVVQVLDGPLKDPAIGILRVSAKSVVDGTEGWISVTGNQGTSYLEEGGNFFKVVKDTLMTDSFESNGSTELTARKLKDGDILEVYEWPRKNEASGQLRLKGKVRNDGAIGWVTLTGNTGDIFLEIV
jgi:hypothetical protein